jgi:hypothetical protein
MTKRILLQSALLPKMALIEVPDDADEAVVRHMSLAAIPQAHQHVGLVVSFEKGGHDDDESDDEDDESTVVVVDGLRIHIGHCKRVEVTVRHFGSSISRKFSPAARLKRVKNWAVKELAIPPAEAARESFRLSGSQEELGDDVHVGTLVTAGTCSVTLDLVPSDRVNGAADDRV